ncbi:MAG: hypothetical protein AB1758_26115 [Candidatus Eremiobacterota bacterium]
MRYRFRIDLRALSRAGAHKRPAEQVDLSPGAEQEPALLPLPVPHGGDPRLEAYNASLVWAERHEPGRFLEGKMEFHVFFDPETGAKHVLNRLAENPHERLSEVVLYPDGSLISRSLARRDGAPGDLSEPFDAGLAYLDEDEQALEAWSGYELRTVVYERDGSQLVGAEAVNRYYDARSQQVVTYPSEV